MIFTCLNFPSSFLNGKSNQNKQCQQISAFCLISHFLSFKHNYLKTLKVSLPVWESININPIMSSLKTLKNEIRQKLDIF
jgi:hypothetical protein